MSDKNGIEIDYCPTCRGVWLDRGELDKIIEKSEINQQPKESNHNDRSTPPASHNYSRHQSDNDAYNHGKSSHPHKKKRESFLGDLFDF